MRKIGNFNGLEHLKAFTYTLIGLASTLLNPAGGMIFGMAFGRFGGMNKYFAYIAVGALLGLLIQTLTVLTASFLGFLPGIIGQVAGWLIVGWVVTLVTSIVLKAFGARK